MRSLKCVFLTEQTFLYQQEVKAITGSEYSWVPSTIVTPRNALNHHWLTFFDISSFVSHQISYLDGSRQVRTLGSLLVRVYSAKEFSSIQFSSNACRPKSSRGLPPLVSLAFKPMKEVTAKKTNCPIMTETENYQIPSKSKDRHTYLPTYLPTHVRTYVHTYIQRQGLFTRREEDPSPRKKLDWGSS